MSGAPHVVILGGGFGGLAAARALARDPVRVTLIDRRNHHLFQPLLYQVATAGLSPSDIAEPLRSVLRRQQNVLVRLAEVRAIDVARKTLRLTPVPGPDHTVADLAATEALHYDALIVAAGVSHAYFGHDDWAAYAPGLKTLGDALEIRRRLLTAFERAEWTDDPVERSACTTFVVVGGGPTGVELAGSLAEIAFRTMQKDFRRVDTRMSRIVLVEAGSGVLTTYSEHLQGRARDALTGLGVEVRTGTMVVGVDTTGVRVRPTAEPEAIPEHIRAETVLWAAGVQGAAVARDLGVPLDRAGRVPVRPDLSIEGHAEVFVVGDLAALAGRDGAPLPGVAPVAIQQGALAARNAIAALGGHPTTPFRYSDKGHMATIGRSKAVLQSGPIELSGLVAWLGWVFVHLMFLVNFRSRLIVTIKWAWAYLTFERSNRLIWQGETRPAPPPEANGSSRQ